MNAGSICLSRYFLIVLFKKNNKKKNKPRKNNQKSKRIKLDFINTCEMKKRSCQDVG